LQTRLLSASVRYAFALTRRDGGLRCASPRGAERCPRDSLAFALRGIDVAAAFAPRAGTDQLLLDIADYVIGYELEDPEALQIARYALLDSLGAQRSAFVLLRCASLTLKAPATQAARCWR
jgi:hypothetical protein